MGKEPSDDLPLAAEFPAANYEQWRKLAEAALRDAKPRSENKFKIELAKRCLMHALRMATAS